jgi:nicotinate-nucleotide pyrophosphorylase (carboxylating)
MTSAASSPSGAAPALGIAPEDLHALVERALAEDLGQGDLTTQLTVSEDARATGTFFAQQNLIVAGLFVAEEIFRSLEPGCRWKSLVEDGAEAATGTALARVDGRPATLLAGERVSLNFLQHLSGVATLTHAYVEKLAGLKTELLDTRKTTPGLRTLEKYAVRAGGGRNHRNRLDDAVLIKNNHLTLSGGITSAVGRAKSRGVAVEVEVRNLKELEEALAAGADSVLLDNMTPERVRECARLAKGRARLEVSGGVSLETVRAYAEAGADAISVGALTHSAPAVAIHFLVERGW